MPPVRGTKERPHAYGSFYDTSSGEKRLFSRGEWEAFIGHDRPYSRLPEDDPKLLEFVLQQCNKRRVWARLNKVNYGPSSSASRAFGRSSSKLLLLCKPVM